ncbi:AAA family ATPase [Chromatium okenii]|uniref:AAA family ATPase n=1 Tax=Chromatium okenii TaxID=61644 RepID=UPI002413AD29|nr:AAA family ATPase [Chromatium okenii]
MQDKTKQVFVIATANDISALPPELLRKGRFDEIFYVDFPTETERVEIFRVHLERRNRLSAQIQLEELAQKTQAIRAQILKQS